jgi:hypothetical protein
MEFGIYRVAKADRHLSRGPTKLAKTDLSEAESYLVGVPTCAVDLLIPRRHAAGLPFVVLSWPSKYPEVFVESTRE